MKHGFQLLLLNAVLTVRAHPVGTGAFAHRHGFGQLGPDVVQPNTVVGGDAGRKTFGDEFREDRPP